MLYDFIKVIMKQPFMQARLEPTLPFFYIFYTCKDYSTNRQTKYRSTKIRVVTIISKQVLTQPACLQNNAYGWAGKILLQKKVLLGSFVCPLLRKQFCIWAYLETRAFAIQWFWGAFEFRRVYQLLHVDKDGSQNWSIVLTLESNSTPH